MVVGVIDLRDPPPGIDAIDVGGDDVADGLFGAADGAQVLDQGGVVGGLDLIPSEVFPTHQDIRFDNDVIQRRGAGSGGSLSGSVAT